MEENYCHQHSVLAWLAWQYLVLPISEGGWYLLDMASLFGTLS